jgi:hypothetical protein
MNSNQNSLPIPPPPGVINALKSGLDVISTHVSIILLPLALDALLWFGPRLSVKNIFSNFFQQTITFYASIGQPVDQFKQAQTQLNEILQNFNVLAFLRTFPVGVPSLMQSHRPVSTPLGAQTVFEIPSGLALLGIVFLVTLVGWMLGAIYFRAVSRLVNAPAESSSSFLWTMAQSLLYSIGFMLVMFIIGFPVMIFLGLLSLLGPAVVQTALFVMMLFASWVVVPLFFTPHGIFVRGENAFRSVMTSLRMSRFILPSASMFVLALFLVAQGLNILWNVPPDDSWMLVVGIAGHAFVTTALLAASFIYYRDMNAWLNLVAERIRTSAPRQAI